MTAKFVVITLETARSRRNFLKQRVQFSSWRSTLPLSIHTTLVRSLLFTTLDNLSLSFSLSVCLSLYYFPLVRTYATCPSHSTLNTFCLLRTLVSAYNWFWRSLLDCKDIQIFIEKARYCTHTPSCRFVSVSTTVERMETGVFCKVDALDVFI